MLAVGMSSYVSVIAPIIAIVNGVIAVYASQFKPESQLIRIALLLTAIVFGGFAAGATIYVQFQSNEKIEAEKFRKSLIHENLGDFIIEAASLLRRLRDANDASVMDDSDIWSDKVVQFLGEKIGKNYVARFIDNSGILVLAPGGIEDQKRIAYWQGIYA